MDKGRLSNSSFEFNATLSECSRDAQGLSVPMSPADELFFNGRIRPVNPSAIPQRTHELQNFEYRSKTKPSAVSKKGNEMEEKCRGRQWLWRNKNESRHRCTARSLSPQRNSSSSQREGKGQRNSKELEEAGVVSASPSPKPRGSWRTWSLKDIFLHRSKSEGREPERESEKQLSISSYAKLPSSDKEKKGVSAQGKPAQKKKMADANTVKAVHISSPNGNGVPLPVSAQELHYVSSPNRRGVPASVQELHYVSSPNRRWVPASVQELHYIPSPNRRGVPVSAHELHYTANRAQAEELRRKTFLPYRQGVLGCLGFPSPSAFPQGHVLQPLY